MKYFETTSKILPTKDGKKPDIERFIERIRYEAICGLEGSHDEYCDKLQKMALNHIKIYEYEIAIGLCQAIILLR